jgi:hypothetical protein
MSALLTRSVPVALATALAAHVGPAAAIEFQIGDEALRVENLFTIGASFRMQEVDPSLVGKSTLYKIHNPGANDPATGSGLCLWRETGTADGGPDANLDPAQSGPNQYGLGQQPAGCSTTNVAANQGFVDAPGSFSPNGDNGDLNFDKGDIVHAVAKLTTDLNYSVFGANIFVRGVAFFDANYSDFRETHYDTSMQTARSELPRSVERIVGVDYDLLDYSIGRSFDIGDRSVSVKVGNQVLNWGESSLLALNSLNTINPPDARRLNTPGLDLKEAFKPIGMITAGTEIIESLSAEVFYAYDWASIEVDPVGTYFSQSDTLGEGGDYAMLSFAKAPEDPGFVIANPTLQEQVSYPTGQRGYYRPIDTCGHAVGVGTAGCIDTLGLLGSTASRTLFRDHAEERRREPDGGDYGIALKMFLESVNNGTEVAFYFANYDSRLPVVSAFAAQDSCLPDNGIALTAVTDCGIQIPTPGGPGQAATEEVVPVDSASLIVEYPEDIKLYGVSFNTTLGDFALSGEYAFRENLPIQIDTADLTYTALQPAFPAQDISVDADTAGGPVPGVTVPGRRTAFPAFLTGYRGYACTSDADCIQPGQYVQGYERFKVGQANLTVLRLIGGDNPIAASQMTLLLEMGMQQVFDMPSLSELQLEGTGSDTHISGGADGTPGIEPAGDPAIPAGSNPLRQNPTANKDYGGYGTSESYGFRFVNLNRWESALFGVINLETLSIVRVDLKGTSPGIGTNFSDGRKQFNFGVRGDYLSTYFGEVRYTWFTGGGKHDGQRDRDNIQVYFGYQF